MIEHDFRHGDHQTIDAGIVREADDHIAGRFELTRQEHAPFLQRGLQTLSHLRLHAAFRHLHQACWQTPGRQEWGTLIHNRVLIPGGVRGEDNISVRACNGLGRCGTWGLRAPARCLTSTSTATIGGRSLKLNLVRRNRAGHDFRRLKNFRVVSLRERSHDPKAHPTDDIVWSVLITVG